MGLIIGVVIVLASVIGGFLLSHGNLYALVQPNELLIIGGAAFGAFVIGNPGHVVKAALGGIPGLLKASPFNKDLYLNLLALMFDLFNKTRREGLMALENDVDAPHESEIFLRYPKIMDGHHHAIEFICDYFRLMVGGTMNPFEIEALMDVELDTHHKESAQPADALQKVADALPGFGIVAAVLGIVVTMGSLGGSTESIGMHVAAALVGTFLGILLAYGFVGPMSQALQHKAEEGSKMLECIKVCLLATLNGYSPQVAVEFGRKALNEINRPGFSELEEYIKEHNKKP